MTTETTETGTIVVAPNFAKFDAEKAISFVRKFDAKEQATEGYRNIKVGYRQTDKKVIAPEPKVVTVPQVTLQTLQLASTLPVDDSGREEVTKALQVLLGALEDGQDAMVRYWVDGESRKVIEWQELAIPAILEYLTTARTGARLTREAIEAWIDASLVTALTLRSEEICKAKLIVAPDLQKQQLAAVTNRYKKIIGGLAAAVPAISMEEAQAAVAMLKRANLADDMARALSDKLNKLLNPPAANNGDL